MGFIERVKALKNALTGGSATVWVSVDSPRLSGEFEVHVKVNVAAVDVDVERVYILLEGREVIEIPDRGGTYIKKGGSQAHNGVVSAKSPTITKEYEVYGKGILQAYRGYEWSALNQLPGGALPEYRGCYCTHTYFIKAGLDCSGNDPDSGWNELYLNGGRYD